MDANVNLQQQAVIIARRGAALAGDRILLAELRRALALWLRTGGFAPDWRAYPEAARYFTMRGWHTDNA